jgi:hypothetical protein
MPDANLVLWSYYNVVTGYEAVSSQEVGGSRNNVQSHILINQVLNKQFLTVSVFAICCIGFG